MVDIVKWLRQLNHLHEEADTAADEIERLHKLTQEWQAAASFVATVSKTAIAELNDENKKLREQLAAARQQQDDMAKAYGLIVAELAACHRTWLSPDAYQALMDERSETLMELAACQRDAERYRWFAEHCPYVVFSVNYETNNLDVMLRDDRMWNWGKEQLDAAIDAARGK